MAIDISDGMVTLASGNVKPKIMMKGWELLVMWKDQSMSWVKLKDLKVSNPIELAEYAVANRIAEELAFKWWVYLTHCISEIISSRR
jgi:phosphoribosylformimino-5-aminoimidazole carboxamide ribonucleotide (ProFAR) isomerase